MKIEIENRAGVIKLNSGVNKESADKLIDDLDRLYGQSAVLAQMCIGEVVCSASDALELVEVEINSPGGIRGPADLQRAALHVGAGSQCHHQGKRTRRQHGQRDPYGR